MTLKIGETELDQFVSETQKHIVPAFKTMLNKLNNIEMNQVNNLGSIKPIIMSTPSQANSLIKGLEYWVKLELSNLESKIDPR